MSFGACAARRRLIPFVLVEDAFRTFEEKGYDLRGFGE